MTAGSSGGRGQIPAKRPSEKLVGLGRISGLHGVRGWVKVNSDTEPKSNVLHYSPWYLGREGGWQQRELETGRAHGKGIIAKLVGCDDRDQAALLVGAEIAVRRDQLPKSAEDEFYWADLEGLEVRTETGRVLGRIDYLFRTGANDVIVVQGDRERLIPYLRGQVIKAIDLDAGSMTVDWDPDF